MKKLFLAYMGGRAYDRIIEDHEILMIVAETLEEAKQKAKQKTKLEKEVHIDLIIEVENIDGYNIKLEKGGTESFKKVSDYEKI